MILRRLLLISSLLALACSSDSSSCVDVACNAGLRVVFSETQREPGAYRVEVDWDGQSASCSTGLPYPECPGGSTCGPLRFSASCWEDPARQSIAGVFLVDITPARVSLRLYRDETLLASRDLQPSYATTRLGGEGCQECTEGEVEWVLW